MEYYKKKLRLLKEIEKRGQIDGMNKIGNKVYNSNVRPLFLRLESAKIISLKKIKNKTYSHLTIRGEKLVKLLEKLEELMNG